MIEKRKIIISGVIVGEPELSHENYFIFYLRSKRESGIEDVIPVIYEEGEVEFAGDATGLHVLIRGELRSRSGNFKCKPFLCVCPRSIELIKPRETDVNLVSVRGILRNKPKQRVTPGGIKISDMMIYSNGSSIPCISWWDVADSVTTLEKGMLVILHGRLQGREYVKRYENGDQETRTAYEVSANWIKEWKDEGF